MASVYTILTSTTLESNMSLTHQALKCTVNWGPIILTNGGGSSRSIGSPGGLNAWGIRCILDRWQHPRREKFSRQPQYERGLKRPCKIGAPAHVETVPRLYPFIIPDEAKAAGGNHQPC